MFKKAFFIVPRYCSILRQLSSLPISKNTSAPAHSRPQKKPFIKNLLAGTFDEDFLLYPEIPNDKLLALENKCLASPKISNSASIKDSFKQILQFINNLEPDLAIEDGYKKNDLNYTHLTRLSECVSSLPLSLLIEIHSICVHKIIEKYCSEEQKRKYLPALLKGDKSIAFCLSEEITGSDPSYLETLAVKDRETGRWNVNGVKSWVTGGQSADLFLVFSKTKSYERSKDTKDLSVFIVDKQTPGLSVENVPSVGLESCGICKVKIENVSLSDGEILGKLNNGYDVAVELLSSFKYSIASQFSVHLKQILKETIKFVSSRKQTSTDLRDCELVRKKLSDVFLTIYTLDSMIYLTSMLADHFDIDATLEFALIHLYCIQNGVEASRKCFDLLGSRVFNSSSPYFQMRKDIEGLSTALHTNDMCKLFIALTGIQHGCKIMGEDVRKIRNSFDYPSFMIKKLISNNRNLKDLPKLNLKLYMNLHPSLESSSNLLEYCVIRLQYCLEQLLVRYGQDFVNRQLHLERLANILLDVFCMTAVLGRSSRSYCTGIKFADDEILLAKTFCHDAHQRCKVSINSMLDNESTNNDLFHLKLAGNLIDHNEYFIEHPLTRNIS